MSADSSGYSYRSSFRSTSSTAQDGYKQTIPLDELSCVVIVANYALTLSETLRLNGRISRLGPV